MVKSSIWADFEKHPPTLTYAWTMLLLVFLKILKNSLLFVIIFSGVNQKMKAIADQRYLSLFLKLLAYADNVCVAFHSFDEYYRLQ